jgi:hypothetical protein
MVVQEDTVGHHRQQVSIELPIRVLAAVVLLVLVQEKEMVALEVLVL